MWEFGDKSKTFFNFVDTCTELAPRRNYGARLELTLNYNIALQNDAKLIHAMNNAFGYATAQPTADLALLLRFRASAIKELAENLHWQHLDRYKSRQLSLVALMSFLSSGLMSRGQELSQHGRALKEYVNSNKCTKSHLALLPYSLEYNRNGHIRLTDDINIQVIKHMFGGRYGDVARALNGTVANAIPSIPTVLLEVSFGFVDQDVSVPGAAHAIVPPSVAVDIWVNEVHDFDLEFFEFQFDTTGNFNIIISSFRRSYIFDDFVSDLVKFWLVDLLHSSQVCGKIMRQLRDFAGGVQASFLLGGGSLLDLFSDATYYQCCNHSRQSTLATLPPCLYLV
ncbi:unnamed protein product [Absidia cylindrospora]